jgi:D-alanine-D-alanine ligase-like ATP-grasp enzyme
LVEPQFEGTEYRLLATRTKLLAATKRVPANVSGDGENDIQYLINEKNDDPRRNGIMENVFPKIPTDSTLIRHLRKQKLTLGSVLGYNRLVYLRKNSNISTGGDGVDVTDIVHPDIAEIAMNAVRAIPGLRYAGVDFMTNKSIDSVPGKDTYRIIEMNASPGFDIHHFPYSGKSRDVASGIVDALFPESEVVSQKIETVSS